MIELSREAAAESLLTPTVAASRLNSNFANFLGLTPKAICCRRLATSENCCRTVFPISTSRPVPGLFGAVG